MKTSNSPEGRFAKLVEEFFLDRLIRQRNSSPQTVAAYRDCFRLLFEFARDRWNKPTERLVLTDLDAPLVLAFLDHLEKDRNNSIRSRNARLAAVRSFLRFAALKNPEALALIQRALAIPMKRCTRPLVGFLSREEVQAIINAPDPTTWAGQRDQVLLSTLYNTGARVSEVRGIKVADVTWRAAPWLSSWQRSQGSNCPHLAGHRSSDPSLAFTDRSCIGRPAVPGCQSVARSHGRRSRIV